MTVPPDPLGGKRVLGFPLQRMLVVLAIVVPVAYAFLINADNLNRPPAWDSLTTVSPAALTIVDHNFDIWEVAQLPSSLQGGPSIHATSLYTMGLAVLIWLLGSETAFYVAHVGSIALVGALSAATYLLARGRASVYVSAFAAGTVSIVPLVVQQAADIYIDLPLAVVTTLACWAASRRRFWFTAALVFLGVAIKTAGVFLIPLLLFARPAKRPGRHLAPVALAVGIALVPFIVAFFSTDRFDREVQLSSTWTLVHSSASMVVLTADLFVVLSVYVLTIYARARSHTLDRSTLAGTLTVLSFFAVYGATMALSQTIAILPRYYVVILPTMIVALLPVKVSRDQWSLARMAGLCLVGVLALFSLINVRGDYYYLPDHEFYVMAERSTRAQDLLQLQMMGTEKLVETGLSLVVDNQVHFRLAYPGMGYVDETPASLITTYELPPELPDHFAMLIERRHTNPLVLVEERALDEGYTLTYEDITYRGFRSQLIVASR